MPSPFPGMNPFLEQDDAWHDFHEKIIPMIAERLVVQVRPEYISQNRRARIRSRATAGASAVSGTSRCFRVPVRRMLRDDRGIGIAGRADRSAFARA